MFSRCQEHPPFWYLERVIEELTTQSTLFYDICVLEQTHHSDACERLLSSFRSVQDTNPHSSNYIVRKSIFAYYFTHSTFATPHATATHPQPQPTANDENKQSTRFVFSEPSDTLSIDDWDNGASADIDNWEEGDENLPSTHPTADDQTADNNISSKFCIVVNAPTIPITRHLITDGNATFSNNNCSTLTQLLAFANALEIDKQNIYEFLKCFADNDHWIDVLETTHQVCVSF